MIIPHFLKVECEKCHPRFPGMKKKGYHHTRKSSKTLVNNGRKEPLASQLYLRKIGRIFRSEQPPSIKTKAGIRNNPLEEWIRQRGVLPERRRICTGRAMI